MYGLCVIISTDLFIVADQQQERAERDRQAEEQAKEKARVLREVELINNTGDDLMYAPIERYITPTVTGSK